MAICPGSLPAAAASAVNAAGAHTHVRDVGTSYGFYAVGAGMTYLLVGDLRLMYISALVGYLSIAAALSGGFGDYGHLTAMALGLAAYPLVARASGPLATPILGNLLPGRVVSRSEATASFPSTAHEPHPD